MTFTYENAGLSLWPMWHLPVSTKGYNYDLYDIHLSVCKAIIMTSMTFTYEYVGLSYHYDLYDLYLWVRRAIIVTYMTFTCEYVRLSVWLLWSLPVNTWGYQYDLYDLYRCVVNAISSFQYDPYDLYLWVRRAISMTFTFV